MQAINSITMDAQEKSTYSEAHLALIEEEFGQLLSNCGQCSADDGKEITRAFEMALDAHAGQNRKTGEPFVLHPLAVARIVSEEMKLDCDAIVAALLHDVVEDTNIINEKIESAFGSNVAEIVEGLTKISRIYYEDNDLGRTNIQAENFVKLLNTISINVRVIYVKIADRLHNMRTLSGMPTNKQLEKAGEVLYVYAPLAHRLGLHEMKTELEDLSFRFRQPEAFEQLDKQILDRKAWHDTILNTIAERMREVFAGENLRVKVVKRKRSYYSTWKRMQEKRKTLDELENFLSIRVIFPDMPSWKQNMLRCWHIYGILSQNFTTNVKHIKDWLSSPRSNGYSALHGAVLSENKWIDVQIMSKHMQEIADRGYGTESNFFNPENPRTILDSWLSHVQLFLKDEDKRDKAEFLDLLKDNLFISDILVYTPKGDIRRLPRHSTVLDFAFHIHTDLGKKCIGGEVNHKMQDRSYVLKNGDTVKVITSQAQTPYAFWYNEITSALAKSKLKRVFREAHKERIINGEKILNDIFSRNQIKNEEQVFDQLEEKFDFLFKYHLYYKIDKGEIKKEDIERALLKDMRNTGQRKGKSWFNNILPFSHSNTEKTVNINPKKEQKLDEDFNTGQVILKDCCHPIPGDEASGYLDNQKRIIVHRNDCESLLRMTGNSNKKIFKIDWSNHKTKSFLSRLEIKGIDRVRLIKDMIKVISDNFGMSIHTVNIAAEGTVFNGIIDIRVHGQEELIKVMKKLKSITGMEEVSRITNF